MNETDITNRIRLDIAARGGYTTKMHSDLMQGAGQPDILGVLRGRALAVEVKMPGEKPRAIQEWTLDQWRRAGAIAFAADSVAEYVEKLEAALLSSPKQIA